MGVMRKIRDVYGRVVRAFAKPDLREVAALSLRDRWSSYPSSGLTPAKLAQIFLLGDQGFLRPQSELYEDIEEKDPHVATCLQTRKLAVASLDWEIIPISDKPEDDEIAKFCQEALEGITDLEDDFVDLLDAVGKGYAMSEVMWEMVGGKVVPIDLVWIHPKKLSWVNSLTPRILTEDDPAMGIEPPPWKTIYHRYRARSGFDMRAGSLRVLAYLYLLKIYAWKDWAAHNEVYGMPLRVGKYPPGISPADREALRDAIVNLGSDAGGIISKETEIEFIESSSRASGRQIPFAVMIDMINREISKAILGQTLTTDTTGGTGTYAAGKVHADVRRDLVAADARGLETTLRSQLLRPLVGFNYGWEKPVPKFKLHYEEGEDLTALSTVVKNLADAGFPFVAEDLAERFGFDLPDKDGKSTVLMPPKAQAQPTQSDPGEEIPEDPANDPGQGKTPPQGTQTPPGGGNGSPDKVAEAMVKAAKKEGAANLVQTVELLRNLLPSINDPMIAKELKVIDIQTENEELVQKALQEAAPVIARLVAPIQKVIDDCSSVEEVEKQLKFVYPAMNQAELAKVLFQVMFIAWMKGRAEDLGRLP